MKVLIDSHAIVWWMTGDSRLSDTAYQLLSSSVHERVLSLASFWELSHKVSTGRLLGIGSTIRSLREAADAQSISILPINFEHILRLEQLPAHHGDPFDRLLIAQALTEGLTILTADSKFRRYEAPILW